MSILKKKVYMVQAGCLYGNTYYLPYAVGMLIAFAQENKTIKESYSFERIIYRFEDIDKCISEMDDPAFVGFSNSIWNYSYNLKFAKKLKKAYPKCIIEFGGHHIPPTTEYLEKYDFIDILIHRKGEEAFRDVLLSLDNGSEMDEIANISFRSSDHTIIQTKESEITICNYPSPYLNGVFDDILKTGEYPFSCVLETNRGCPFNCCYCDWGELNTNVRMFDIEKVMAELHWMSEHQMDFVYCIDANFGMFERDELIAQKLVELKEKTGYPNRLQVSYAKNAHDRVFRINKLLAEHGIGKGATLSLQSLSEEVLHNIGRVNITKKDYMTQISNYRAAGIPTYTELILGLPGETLESFSRGLCDILEMGQHSSVSAYYCELLPNSQMSRKEYIEKYNIGTVSTALNQYHCEQINSDLPGFSNIVVSTNTMSAEDWIKANIFSTCVQSFHHFGLLQFLAIYIRKEIGISYYDFYSDLCLYVFEKTTLCKSIFNNMLEILVNFVNGKGGLTYQNDIFGKITYPIEEAVFLLLLYNRDEFYSEIKEFISKYINDEMLLDDLLSYQKEIVLYPGDGKKNFRFSYDFKSYFDEALKNSYIPLKKEKTQYLYTCAFSVNDWEEYAKIIIWYGRRNGRMLYSNIPNSIESV